jgi:hypothetical protein
MLLLLKTASFHGIRLMTTLDLCDNFLLFLESQNILTELRNWEGSFERLQYDILVTS